MHHVVKGTLFSIAFLAHAVADFNSALASEWFIEDRLTKAEERLLGEICPTYTVLGKPYRIWCEHSGLKKAVVIAPPYKSHSKGREYAVTIGDTLYSEEMQLRIDTAVLSQDFNKTILSGSALNPYVVEDTVHYCKIETSDFSRRELRSFQKRHGELSSPPDEAICFVDSDGDRRFDIAIYRSKGVAEFEELNSDLDIAFTIERVMFTPNQVVSPLIGGADASNEPSSVAYLARLIAVSPDEVKIRFVNSQTGFYTDMSSSLRVSKAKFVHDGLTIYIESVVGEVVGYSVTGEFHKWASIE